jgi:hypothetical protein
MCQPGGPSGPACRIPGSELDWRAGRTRTPGKVSGLSRFACHATAIVKDDGRADQRVDECLDGKDRDEVLDKGRRRTVAESHDGPEHADRQPEQQRRRECVHDEPDFMPEPPGSRSRNRVGARQANPVPHVYETRAGDACPYQRAQ